MPSMLWGRAESVRTSLRKLAEAAAPLSFGYLAQHLFGGSTAASGLHATFLVMVVALGAAGAVALFAARTYARDVATARQQK